MVTGKLKFYHLLIYSFLDPGASLSFVIPYIAVDLGASPEILAEPFLVSYQWITLSYLNGYTGTG